MAALIDEFGLEPDRRAVGDDLQIMIGQSRQQGSARHLGDLLDVLGQAALEADRGADVRCGGVALAGGEVEQHAIRREVGDAARIEILDRRIIATIEQRNPIVIGTDVHAALVGPDRAGDVVIGRHGLDRGRVIFARIVRITVHATSPDWSKSIAICPTGLKKALSISVQSPKPVDVVRTSLPSANAAVRGVAAPRAALAQLVEHRIRNAGVTGSSPVGGTTHHRWR